MTNKNKLIYFSSLILFVCTIILILKNRTTQEQQEQSKQKAQQVESAKFNREGQRAEDRTLIGSNDIGLSKNSQNISESELLKLGKTEVLNQVEQKKLELLVSLIEQKNDNDKRIDTELINLSPEFHRKLFHLYEGMEMENRNGRGFVAFVLARDIQGTQDIEFLKNIFMESPCLSFSDCQKGGTSSDPHHSVTNEISLNYPQMIVIRMLEKKLSHANGKNINSDLDQGMHDILQEAKKFPVSRVQNMADNLQRRIRR